MKSVQTDQFTVPRTRRGRSKPDAAAAMVPPAGRRYAHISRMLPGHVGLKIKTPVDGVRRLSPEQPHFGAAGQPE